MAHKKRGFRFESDWDGETVSQVPEIYNVAIAIPVNMELKAEQKIVSFDRALAYLDDAGDIYVIDCNCRTTLNNCDSPKNTCIGWDSPKRRLSTDYLKEKNAQKISMEEAAQVLKMSNEAGLVHMAYAMYDDEVNAVCSCCSCCCLIFSSILRFGHNPGLISSDSVSATDMEKCDNCGDCIDVCHFGFRELIDNKLKVNDELCYGCGLCVLACPIDVIAVVSR
jgi:NAD-dependent dihydropyrimidine dehydrogenase PreA subunit